MGVARPLLAHPAWPALAIAIGVGPLTLGYVLGTSLHHLLLALLLALRGGAAVVWRVLGNALDPAAARAAALVLGAPPSDLGPTTVDPAAVTVLGANPLTNECHTAFVDPGATANDTCAGALSVTTARITGVVMTRPGVWRIAWGVCLGLILFSIISAAIAVGLGIALGASLHIGGLDLNALPAHVTRAG